MKEKLKYCLYTAMFQPLSLLPLKALYGLSDFTAWLLGSVLGYRAKIIDRNLATSFPDKSPAELKKIKRGFYKQLADDIVETVKLLHISDKQLLKRIKVENADLIDECYASGHPAIVFLGHFGNWEWVPAVSMHYNPEILSTHIYKAPHDAAFDRFMKKVRGRFNSTGIEQHATVRTLLDYKQQGRLFISGFIADHRSNSPVAHQHVEFLNHTTSYNVGGEAIGMKVGARFFYLDIFKEKRGHYRFRFVPLDIEGDTAPHPYTRQYMKLLEQSIRRQPHLWLWSHRRWLYDNDNTPQNENPQKNIQ